MSEQRDRIVASVRRALVGEVFSSVRAVWARYTETKVHLLWVVDTVPTDEEMESVSSIETEVQADFDPGVLVDSELIVGPDVSLQADANDMLVYTRGLW